MVFDLIYLFASVDMYITKSIFPETSIFVTNIAHHVERAKSYTYNLLNFTKSLYSNI